MDDRILIHLERVEKQYETGAGVVVPVLKGIDLTVRRGEFVAVMGSSGSGKSTLMNILGCLDVPTAGDYTLNGEDVSRLTIDQLAGIRSRLIGFVFQVFNLLPRMDAVENTALPLLYTGMEKHARRERALKILNQLGLERFSHHRPNQLSGGQQQRVAIARALINQPDLILADEPTGNLDSRTSEEIMGLFCALNRERGLTLVLVTHDVEIARHAQRLVRLVDGRIEADGPVGTVLGARK